MYGYMDRCRKAVYGVDGSRESLCKAHGMCRGLCPVEPASYLQDLDEPLMSGALLGCFQASES